MELEEADYRVTVYHRCTYPGIHNLKNQNLLKEKLLPELVENIKKGIETEMERLSPTHPTDIPDDKLHMAIILDEANNWKDILSTADSLRDAKDVLRAGLRCIEVRLIVAGTGYDIVAKEMSSLEEVYKHRMQPWTDKSIRKWATRVHQDAGNFLKPDEVMTCLRRYPILAQLATNARTAVYLIDNNNELAFRALCDAPRGTGVDVVSELVRKVAQSYQGDNGLRSKTMIEKKQIAMAAFKVLNESWKQLKKPPKEQMVPELSTYFKDGNLEATAWSLLESNFEYKDGKPILLDQRYASIFISPALAIVLYYTIGIPAPLFGDWQALEVVAGLSRYRRSILDACPDEKLSNGDWLKYKVMSLGQPVPATSSKTNFQVPNWDKWTIWVNGDRASFADYVGFQTLGQCKFTADANEPAIVKLDEFEKLGALKVAGEKESDTKDRIILRRAVLHALRSIWNEGTLKAKRGSRSPRHRDGEEVEGREGPNRNDDEKNIKSRLPWMFPEDLFIARGTPERIDTVACSIVDSDNVDEDKGMQKVLLLFDGTERIVQLDDDIGNWTIELVTNSNSVKLVSNKDNIDTVVVTPDDIDEDGNCTDTKENEVKQWLEGHEIDTNHFRVHFFFSSPREENKE